MSRVQPKKKMFFSRFCEHCKTYLGALKDWGLLGFFDEYICVDFNNNLPDFVKFVPTIVVPGETQLPISGDEACQWLGDKIDKMQQMQQKKQEVKEQGVVGASDLNLDADEDAVVSAENPNGIKSIGLGGSASNAASLNDDGPMFSKEDQARFNQQHTNRTESDFEASRALPDIPKGQDPRQMQNQSIDPMPSNGGMTGGTDNREIPSIGKGNQQMGGMMDGRMNSMQQGPPLSGSNMGGNMGDLNAPTSGMAPMGSMGIGTGGNMPGMFQQNGPLPQRF